ncbi:MAG: aminoglycoside phosphotransferase family protein [Elusimicrobiota bacterium]
MRHETAAANAAAHFEMPGDLLRAEPFGHGHINDTYRLTFDHEGTRRTCPTSSQGTRCRTASAVQRRYILQRINSGVFHDPLALLDNMQRVLEHLKRKVSEPRRVLHPVPARDGRPYWKDAAGEYWRAADFIEGTVTHFSVRTAKQAYEAAKAYGRFQSLLADLPGPRLKETIPGFHDTPKRVADFRSALQADAVGRVKEVAPEAEFALEHAGVAGRLHGGMRERVVHNDTKVDNVLFDNETGEGLCVIDLDTVMPGLPLHDFGDLVRSAISTTAEDSTDLSKLKVSKPIFDGLARGYLETAGEFLSRDEVGLLAFSGRLIAYELGVRFLTDYLNGDTYFKIHHPKHNLERSRVQFRLAELLGEAEAELQARVERLAAVRR